jgi:hypothetical protein
MRRGPHALASRGEGEDRKQVVAVEDATLLRELALVSIGGLVY